MQEDLSIYYKDSNLGYSFELPDSWRHEKNNLTLTFFGPNGYLGCTSELIQIKTGTIQPEFRNQNIRKQFLAEPGAKISSELFGDEKNTVIMKNSVNTEISIVHDNIHYVIKHSNDQETEAAIEHLKRTLRFPSAEQTASAIKSSSNPQNQAIYRAITADSPENSRRILTDAGMPPAITRQGYTMHKLNYTELNKKSEDEPLKKHRWRLWK